MRWCLLVWLVISTSAAAQSVDVILFDEDVDAATAYYDSARAAVTGSDVLETEAGAFLPLVTESYAGVHAGRLTYRHVDGSWEVALDRTADLSGFDSVIVYLNGPESLAGAELPRVALEDDTGARSAAISLSRPGTVTVDSLGFTAESQTNAIFTVRYIDTVPVDERRPGYPEDLIVRFDDEAADTSVAGIGAPSIAVRFTVETASGLQADVRFRDVNDDSTLSADGEYIEILLPRSYDDPSRAAAWRIELAPTQGPQPIVPPGEGDVFRAYVSDDGFAIDDDPATWQRLSIPLNLFEGSIDAAAHGSVVFSNGGPNADVRTLWFDRLTAVQNDDEAFLEMIQRLTFDYFWEEANPANGLIKDRSTVTSPSSIAAVGFGLSAITVGIDRGYITYEEGRERVFRTLDFFWNAEQSTDADATGYKGFFYHFLDMQTGRRAWTSELSTIDTALLLGGVVHVYEYFASDDVIRTLARDIYERVDWTWAQARPPAISHGWRPETGFISNDWIGYNEAVILYILALGSPTHPVQPDAWEAWVNGYDNQWRTEYGYTFLTFPPLFGHQYSHVWVDFRDIQDAYMRSKGIDYFENSRRATLAQRAYHIDNPKGWPNYSKDEWGLTASDIKGGYLARGAPPAQNDEGTLVPTAPGGSIAFTPEESIAALRTMYRKYPLLWGPYGFRDAYNVSQNWFDGAYLGIDQGPIILMIENLRTEAVWTTSMQNAWIQDGLAAAGFEATPVSTDVETTIDALVLAPNYPNPFARSTRIAYTLPHSGLVRVEIYDLLGRRVSMPVDDVQSAGPHTVDFDAAGLAAGVYVYVVQHGEIRTSRFMLLVR